MKNVLLHLDYNMKNEKKNLLSIHSSYKVSEFGVCWGGGGRGAGRGTEVARITDDGISQTVK